MTVLKASIPALAAALALAALPAAADTISPRAAHHAARHHVRARHSQETAANQIAPLTPARHVPVADPNAAPMPDLNVTPPVDNSDQSTSVEPAVMQIHYPNQGDGYVSGSSAQAMDDRDAAKVTGVQLHVPLTQ